MTKFYVHKFTVTGTLPFPLDMLRYDSACPALSEDAAAIGRTLDPVGADEAFKITLHHIGPSYWQPTYGRWKSFGWSVEGETDKWEVL